MKRYLRMLVTAYVACAVFCSAFAAAFLGLGSRGDEVIELQRKLIDGGFLIGPADGIFGNRTRDGVILLQKTLRLQGHAVKVDGLAGPETLRLLQDDAVMEPLFTLFTGSSGPRVTTLQERLIDLRFLHDVADGHYGPKTAAAVALFQDLLRQNGVQGIQVNGTADPLTLRMAFSDLDGQGIVAPPLFDDSRPLELTGDWLYAPSCVLVDAEDGRTLFEKEANCVLYPASTTKIMTLLVALESGFPFEREVRIPPSAAEVPEDSSLVPVTPGETMAFRDLLYALMIRSGNDAANAVAEITRGSIEAFVEEMNRRAAALDMQNTRFANPHGYHHAAHYTSATDLSKLAVYALKDERFRTIVSAGEYRMEATTLRGPLVIRNAVELLDPASSLYYEGAFGIKKGYTRAAGFCYVGAAQRDEKTLLCVVLGGRDRFRTFTDMGRLFDHGFALMAFQKANP